MRVTRNTQIQKFEKIFLYESYHHYLQLTI